MRKVLKLQEGVFDEALVNGQVKKRQYKKYNEVDCPNDNTKTILITNWKSIAVFYWRAAS
jgi:hypothetical protein